MKNFNKISNNFLLKRIKEILPSIDPRLIIEYSVTVNSISLNIRGFLGKGDKYEMIAYCYCTGEVTITVADTETKSSMSLVSTYFDDTKDFEVILLNSINKCCVPMGSKSVETNESNKQSKEKSYTLKDGSKTPNQLMAWTDIIIKG